MIPCPEHGPTANYSMASKPGKDNAGLPSGGYVTLFYLACGCTVTPHPARREPVDRSNPEGPVNPDYEIVLAPKDAEIAELKAEIAALKTQVKRSK